MTSVVRAHGLPVPTTQVRRRVAGRVTYTDVDFSPHPVLVELDGRLGHDTRAERFRDHRRDNGNAEEGRTTLRYGAEDCGDDPCAVAVQVAAVLRRAGWGGDAVACGPRCRLA